MSRLRRGKRPHDERGAILIITVLLVGATLALASFVVDLGADRIVLRDMQSVADVTALDLTRNLDGRTASGYAGFSASGPTATLFATEKAATVARQHGLFAQPDSVTARLAVADQQTGTFIRWASASDVPNAIRVYALGSSAFRMVPTTPRSTQLLRSALGVIGRPLVCISAGATVADLTPGGTLDRFLGGLIGQTQLTAVSPAGALSGQIPLGPLATQLGVGTVDELTSLNVTNRNFLIAAATVLSNNGDTAGASALNAIATRLSVSTLNVGSIFALNTGAGKAADLNVDAFSLAQALIEVSNKNNFVNVAVPTGVNIAGLVSNSITLRAKVIEAPQIACGLAGSTTAKSSQVQIELKGTVISALVTSLKIDPLLVTAGNGSGAVTNVTCSLTGSTVNVNANSNVGALKLHLPITLLKVGILPAVELVADVPDPASKPDGAALGSSTTTPMTFNVPAGSATLPPPQTAGGGNANLGLSSITPVKVTPLGAIGGTLLSTLLGVVDTAVSPLINAVTASLGVRVGTVTIAPTTRPACNTPVLTD